jgi:hypothetical protein
LREKHAQLDRDKRKLLDDNQSLKLTKEQLDRDNHLLRSEKYSLELQNQQLGKDNQVLGGNNRELKLKTQQLSKQLEQRHLKAKAVSSRLSSRHYRSAGRNLASLPGEALPFVGIPIAVAGVALDVADSCATLRDINELNQAFGLPKTQEAQVICDKAQRIPTTDTLVKQISHGWENAYKTSVKAINDAQQPVNVPKLPLQPPDLIDILRNDGCRIFGSNLSILGVPCN